MFQTPPPEGARVLACFYDVWYLATVLAVHSSDDVEVRWESEESRSHVGLKDLRRIGDPVQDFANIVPSAAVLARFGDEWHPGTVRQLCGDVGMVEILWDSESSISHVPFHDVLLRVAEEPHTKSTSASLLHEADHGSGTTGDGATAAETMPMALPPISSVVGGRL